MSRNRSVKTASKSASKKSKLPAYLDLSRPEQPRWFPSPRLRHAGWKSTALRLPDRTWLSLGAAIDAAEAINRLVADWDAGIPLDPHAPWIRAAPDGALGAPVTALRNDSIGALLDAYKTSPDYLALKPTTQASYAKNFKRMLDLLAGYDALPARPPLSPDPDGDTRAHSKATLAWTRYQAAVQKVCAQPVIELCAPENPLALVYWTLARPDRPGGPVLSQANALITAANLWIGWVRRNQKRLLPFNPCEDIRRKSPEGRVRIWSQDQIDAVIRQAEAEGWVSLSLITQLALELSWSQKDLLSLTVGQIRDTRVRGVRAKTGNLVHTTLTEDGQRIMGRALSLARERAAARGGVLNPFDPLFVVDKGERDRGQIGQPWKPDHFRHEFIALRQRAGVTGVTFADLRDTAITRMKEAGLTNHEIQSRSQHSLKQIDRLLDQHYGLTTLDISDAAAEKLNARAGRAKTCETKRQKSANEG